MFKKILAGFVLMFGLTFGVTQADVPPALSNILTTTTGVQVCTGPCMLLGAIASGTETNATNCYANTSATGNPVLSVIQGASLPVLAMPASGIKSAVGWFCQVPTAIVGTVTILYYQ